MNPTRVAWHAFLVELPCKTCGAPAGEPCKSSTGKKVQLGHAGRWRWAVKRMKEKQ